MILIGALGEGWDSDKLKFPISCYQCKRDISREDFEKQEKCPGICNDCRGSIMRRLNVMVLK